MCKCKDVPLVTYHHGQLNGKNPTIYYQPRMVTKGFSNVIREMFPESLEIPSVNARTVVGKGGER
jgi:hypothetical protein